MAIVPLSAERRRAERRAAAREAPQKVAAMPEARKQAVRGAQIATARTAEKLADLPGYREKAAAIASTALSSIPGTMITAVAQPEDAAGYVQVRAKEWVSHVAQPEDAAGYVQLGTGEWVSQEAFDSLSAEDQHALRQMGVDKFNAIQERRLESTHIKLSTGEWVSQETFNSLSAEDQHALRQMGVDKFNAIQEKRAELLESTHIKLSTGEWVSQETFNSLSAEDQHALRQMGVDKFNAIQEKRLESTHIKLSTDEWVPRSSFEELSSEDQQLLMQMGVESFNAQKQAEFERNHVQVGNNEWMSLEDYESLSPRAQEIVTKLGIEHLNRAIQDISKDLFTGKLHRQAMSEIREKLRSLVPEFSEITYYSDSAAFDPEKHVMSPNHRDQELAYYIDRASWETLPEEDQQYITQRGLESYNTRSKAYLSDLMLQFWRGELEGYTYADFGWKQLPNGTWVCPKEYEAWEMIPDWENVIANMQRLQSGEYIPHSSFWDLPSHVQSMTPEQQSAWLASPEGLSYLQARNILFTQGTAGYEAWISEQQQRAQAYQQALRDPVVRPYVTDGQVDPNHWMTIIGGGVSDVTLRALGWTQSQIASLRQQHNVLTAMRESGFENLVPVQTTYGPPGETGYRYGGEYDVIGALAAGVVTPQEIAQVFNLSPNELIQYRQLANIQQKLGDMNIHEAIVQGVLDRTDILILGLAENVQQAKEYVNAVQVVSTTEFGVGQAVSAGTITEQQAIMIGFKPEDVTQAVADWKHYEAEVAQVERIQSIQDKISAADDPSNPRYITPEGDYHLAAIMADDVLSPGEIMEMFGQTEEGRETVRIATEQAHTERLAAIRQEHSGTKALAQNIANTYLDWTVPGYATVRHWDNMGTGMKAMSIAADAMMLIPIFGAAGRGARGVTVAIKGAGAARAARIKGAAGAVFGLSISKPADMTADAWRALSLPSKIAKGHLATGELWKSVAWAPDLLEAGTRMFRPATTVAGETVTGLRAVPIHTHELATATTGRIKSILGPLETLVHPSKIPESVISDIWHTVKIPLKNFDSATDAMAAREKIMNAMMREGNSLVLETPDYLITFRRSRLMQEAGGGLAHVTPQGEQFVSGTIVQWKNSKPLWEQGIFWSHDPALRFAEMSGYGLRGEKPAIYIADPNWAKQFTRPSQKTYRGAVELEAISPVGTHISAPQQRLFTRLGHDGQRVEILLQKRLTKTQILKLKALGLVGSLQNLYSPVIVIEPRGPLGAEETARLLDFLEDIGQHGIARNLRVVAADPARAAIALSEMAMPDIYQVRISNPGTPAAEVFRMEPYFTESPNDYYYRMIAEQERINDRYIQRLNRLAETEEGRRILGNAGLSPEARMEGVAAEAVMVPARTEPEIERPEAIPIKPPRIEAPLLSEPRPVAPGTSEPYVVPPRAEDTRPEAPRLDVPRVDVPRVEVPRVTEMSRLTTPVTVPRIKIPVKILLAADGDEEKARKLLEASVTWRQGMFWVIRFPPYSKDDVAWVREVPEGVTVVDGPRSAYLTIQRLAGDIVPEAIDPMEMGFQRVDIAGEGEDVKGIQFTPIKEKTKLRRKPKRKYTKRSPYWQSKKSASPQLAGSLT